MGRITAMVNHELSDRDGTPVGTVGFFECDPDFAVAEALLNASTQWLAEVQGIRRIWGPMNFDIWHGYRFMTRGYNHKQFLSEPHNKDYYPEYYERYGFSVKDRWQSLELSGRDNLEQSIQYGNELYQQLTSDGYRFRSFDMTVFENEIRKLHRLISSSFRGFLGYTPIGAADFESLFRSGIPAFDPDLFIFAYNSNDEPVGFACAYIEISDALRAMRRRCNPLAKIKFLIKRRRSKRLMFYIIGIAPDHSEKGLGLGSALYYTVVRKALESGYETMLAALMSASSRSRTLLGGYTGENRREYALYELNP